MEKNYPSVTGNGFSLITSGDALVVASDSVAQRWMDGQKSPRRATLSVNANQLTSISAMIAYIAHVSGQSEFRIERSLSDHFNVPNAKFLPADGFDDAIRYLADIFPPQF